MNIAMIETVSSHGGMNYYDYGLMCGLAKQHCDVTLYTSTALRFDISMYKNLRVKLFYDGIFTGKNKIKRFLKYLTGTIRALHDAKIKGSQVVHFQIFAITVLEILVVFFAKLFHFPIIVTVHDVESFNKANSKKGIRYFYKHVDKIIVHNQISYDTLHDFFVSDKHLECLLPQIVIIHHGSYIGMLPERINKTVAKQKFRISEDTFTFLFFGQIKRVKGLDVLLYAFAKLIACTDRKIKLIIAGKLWKDDFDIYEKIIRAHSLSEYLILDVKYISDEDIVYYYSSADCLVLPYKKIFQSGVLLMAQSYQVPVLVSDLTGMTEIVTDCENGFVFETENADSLCKKMKQCMEQKNLERISKIAYDKLQAEYNWDEIAKEQVSVIEAML